MGHLSGCLISFVPNQYGTARKSDGTLRLEISMRAELFNVTVTDLRRAVAFYSRLFSSSPLTDGGHAVFDNGLEVWTEDEWRKKLSLPPDFTFTRTLASAAVFVTDEFDSLLKILRDPFYEGHVLTRKEGSVVVIDDDLNAVIIRDSGLSHAEAHDEHVSFLGEKGFSIPSDNWKK